MTTARRLLIASALAAVSAGLASANSINGSCTSVGPAHTELGTTGDAAQIFCTGPVGLTADDQITSVTLTINGAIVNTSTDHSVVTVHNTTSSTQTGSASTNSKFFLTSSLSGFSFPGIGVAHPLFAVEASTGPVSIAAGATETFGVTGSGDVTKTNTTNLSPYENSFTIDFGTKTALTNGIGGGNNVTTQTTWATAGAEVEYTYQVNSGTPEPGTMGLLGSALVAIGLLGKRFRRSKS
jgi:hypothetical protein